MNKEFFIEALENLKGALLQARPFIDDLNGYLDNVEEYSYLDEEELSEDTLELLTDLHELYMELPTWDTIDELAERLETAKKEIEE